MAPKIASLAAAMVLTLQWAVLRVVGLDLSPTLVATAAGLSILGAAFLLSWSAEVAEMDVPQALALAFLAFIAVLPEYSVDLYFAWQAGQDPNYTKYATANMTGANRLLIGVGWAGVVYAAWAKSGRTSLELGRPLLVEISFLAIATAYSFAIPVKGTISLLDAAILFLLFGAYLVAAARAEHCLPEIHGPAELIVQLRPAARRAVTVSLFLLAGGAILAAAEPFAEGLLETGRRLGIEEFILVQWLAPLASEAPEFTVATLFALRGKPNAGIGTLISSKVNQWTLLIGALPVVYSLSGGHVQPMMLDGRQIEEVFLTAAQSLLAVIVIADLRFSVFEATILGVLFLTQMVTTSSELRFFFAAGYVVLALFLLIAQRSTMRAFVELVSLRAIRGGSA